MLATGSNDREARIWECPSGKLMNKLPEHPQTVTSIEFSPDGSMLATACWRSTVAQVWSVNDWQRISHIRNPEGHLVEEVTFSPDSRLLAASSDRAKELVIWDVRSGETVAKIDVPLADYWNASFSHDGKWVLTMCRNDSNTRPSGGPVILEVPNLCPPVPEWFPDFLRFLLQHKIDSDGHRRVLTPVEWESMRSRITAAAHADRSRYGELARWFLAPADQRPVRPGETMTRHQLADRLITPTGRSGPTGVRACVRPCQPYGAPCPRPFRGKPTGGQVPPPVGHSTFAAGGCRRLAKANRCAQSRIERSISKPF